MALNLQNPECHRPTGSLFKVLHWSGANIQLLIGTTVQVTALIALALNIARRQNLNELLER